MCDCECGCKVDTQNTPTAFGCIVVYELAIIIMILLFIYLDLGNTCCKIKKTDKIDKITEESEGVAKTE